MTSLADLYQVRERFQRATRIDTIDGREDSLDGFILHSTGRLIIERMRDQIDQSDARAFTWTGPYGTGKSTLALLLANEASYPPKRGRPKYPRLSGHWKVIRVIGSRKDPVLALANAVFDACTHDPMTKDVVDERQTTADDLLKQLQDVSSKLDKEGMKLLVIIDEMGQFLEYCAEKRQSLIFFQDLAERFGRFKGVAVVLGILHQAFEDYAGRIDRGRRNEWAKVQGRFLDTPFAITIEESLGLVRSAITGPEPDTNFLKKSVEPLCKAVDGARLGSQDKLVERLVGAYPLHPVSAILLPAITRQKFGQNERSLFSFLASGEPHGFRDFLNNTPQGSGGTYLPIELWRYLEANLQQSIIASPAGHRWSEALEALIRSNKGDGLHQDLVCTIALIDIFGRSLGIFATKTILSLCFPNEKKGLIEKALKELQTWSAIVYRRHTSAYAISSGSDVDVDEALDNVIDQIRHDTSALLKMISEVEPAIAKRNYHETGTLRWFSVHCVSQADVESGRLPMRRPGADGRFVFLIGNDNEETYDLSVLSERHEKDDSFPIVFGTSIAASRLLDSLIEVAALERIFYRLPELQTDAVARREVAARLEVVQRTVERQLDGVLQHADWWLSGKKIPTTKSTSFSRVADWVADSVFPKTPILKNELLNRSKPSANAVAARKALAYAMVQGEKSQDLGVKKFPPEMGLYLSILKATGTHTKLGGSHHFVTSGTKLDAAFSVAKTVISETENSRNICTLGVLFDVWEKPPYGIKAGLHQILALAYALANRSSVAVYVDGVFTPDIDDYVVDRIFQNSIDVGFRAVTNEENKVDLLLRLGAIMHLEGDTKNPLNSLDVARALAKFAHNLPSWTQRTRILDPATLKVRRVLLDAFDPYDLIFNQLPDALNIPKKSGQIATDLYVQGLSNCINELSSAYGEMLKSLKTRVFSTLAVKNHMKPEKEIAKRAKRLHGTTGLIAFDGLLVKLLEAENNDGWVTALCSGLADCPPRDWTDDHILRAQQRLSEFGMRFRQAEGLGEVELELYEHAINLFVARPGAVPVELVRKASVSTDRVDAIDRLGNEIAKTLENNNLTDDECLVLAIQLIEKLQAFSEMKEITHVS